MSTATAPRAGRVRAGLLAILAAVIITATLTGTASAQPASQCLVNGAPQAGTTIMGTNGNDRIDCTPAGNIDQTIQGFQGNDTILGGGGNDRLEGAGGNDRLEGAGGNDLLVGGNGSDFLAGGNGDDELRGGSGDDELRGGSGNDRCNGGAGVDTAAGCETITNIP